jgi:hypothetical protein
MAHTPLLRSAAASLLLAGGLLARPLPSLAAGDPTWPTNGFTDVSANPIQVDLDFTDKSGAHQNVNATSVPSNLVPPDVGQLLQNPVLTTPLATFFDSQWNATDPKTRQSLHDGACATIKSNLIDQVHQSLNVDPYNISCNLATSGSVGVLVADGTMTTQEPPGWHYSAPFYLVPGGQHLLLSYWLPGDSVSFSVPVGSPENVLGDPSYTVTFDATLRILADVADNYPATCTDAVYSWSEASNANVNASNVAANVDDAVAGFVASVNGQPTAIFQTTEGQIDSGTYGSGTLGALSTAFDQLRSACDSARTVGFTQLQAGVQNNTLAFTFTHPDLAAPSLTNLAAQRNGQSFLNDQLGVQQLQVHAGDSDPIDGFFDIPSVTTLEVGGVGGSADAPATVRWGPHGKAPEPVNVTGDEFDPTNLAPNTSYDFQAQVCDLVTCSAWSDTLSASTSAVGSDQVSIALASGDAGCSKKNACPVVGTTTVNADGTFSGSIAIPAATKPGPYTLQARVGGGAQSATTSLTVVGASVSAQPLLVMWDTVANRAYSSTSRTVQGGRFTLHGEAFAPGPVNIMLDKPNGQMVGTATAGADGSFQETFTMPYASTGKHMLVSSGAPKATLDVAVEGAAQ